MSYFVAVFDGMQMFHCVVGDEGRWFPADEANKDYQAYLAWVDEGNTAEEWNPNGNQ